MEILFELYLIAVSLMIKFNSLTFYLTIIMSSLKFQKDYIKYMCLQVKSRQLKNNWYGTYEQSPPNS